MNSFTNKSNRSDLLTHCKRELFHAVWKKILDEEFIEAYRNGIVIKCHDGVLRRVYPQIFTYSADYPEKYVGHSCLGVTASASFDRVIITTIRDKGFCPCPRCNLPKASFNRLGFHTDFMARLTCARSYLRDKICTAIHAIYKLGNPIKGTVVETLLKNLSLVPTLVKPPFILSVLALISHKNTFAERLSPFGFDIFPALVVDLMHEFELGVLKTVLKHLIRILYAIDADLVSTLNERLALLIYYSCYTVTYSRNITDFLRYRHLGLVEFAVFRRT